MKYDELVRKYCTTPETEEEKDRRIAEWSKKRSDRTVELLTKAVEAIRFNPTDDVREITELYGDCKTSASEWAKTLDLDKTSLKIQTEINKAVGAAAWNDEQLKCIEEGTRPDPDAREEEIMETIKKAGLTATKKEK